MYSSKDLLNYIEPEVASLLVKNFELEPKEEVILKLEECIKFLFLMSKHPELMHGFLPVSQEIDDVWHYLIIQTREYQAMCERLPGKFFIHHKSIHFNVYAELKTREQILREFMKWIPFYVQYFGGYTDATAPFWIAVKLLDKTMGMPLEKINQVGAQDKM